MGKVAPLDSEPAGAHREFLRSLNAAALRPSAPWPALPVLAAELAIFSCSYPSATCPYGRFFHSFPQVRKQLSPTVLLLQEGRLEPGRDGSRSRCRFCAGQTGPHKPAPHDSEGRSGSGSRITGARTIVAELREGLCRQFASPCLGAPTCVSKASSLTVMPEIGRGRVS